MPSLTIKPDNKTSRLEVVLEVYFFVALLSTTGLDNLVWLTALMMGMVLTARVGGLMLSSASAILTGAVQSFW